MLVVAMSCAEEEEVHTSSSSVGIANELLEGLQIFCGQKSKAIVTNFRGEQNVHFASVMLF